MSEPIQARVVGLKDFEPVPPTTAQLKDNFYNCRRCLGEAEEALNNAIKYVPYGRELHYRLEELRSQLLSLQFEDVPIAPADRNKTK